MKKWLQEWLQDMVDATQGGDDGGQTVIDRPPETVKKNEDAPAKPPMYAIYLHNDASTFPDFVVRVMVACFGLDEPAAIAIMLKADRGDKAVVKVVSREIAETEVGKANDMARTGRPGYDFGRGEVCELTFSFAPEAAGD